MSLNPIIMELELLDWFGDGPGSQNSIDTIGISRIHDPRPPLMGVVTARDIRADAMMRASNIATDFKALHSIVQRHEATIQKRWDKKTRQQRAKTIVAAWPNMAVGHRPEFQAYIKKETPRNLECREHYIWPYINQQDLCGSRSLLILLNARARHPPPKFAGADFVAMHIGIILGSIKPATLNDKDYVMVLHGITRSVGYGRMQALKTSDEYSTWLRSGKQFRPGHGLLVFEAQERLSKFLIHCCLQILHDIPENTLTINFPIIPEPQLHADNDDTCFESLSVMAATAPYRFPDEIDFDRMEPLLAAKVAAVEDHIWSLREDPGYFVDELLNAKDHRLHMVEDIHGRPGPPCRRGNENELWEDVHGTVILPPILDLEIFGDLHEQVKGLRALRTKYIHRPYIAAQELDGGIPHGTPQISRHALMRRQGSHSLSSGGNGSTYAQILRPQASPWCELRVLCRSSHEAWPQGNRSRAQDI